MRLKRWAKTWPLLPACALWITAASAQNALELQKTRLTIHTRTLEIVFDQAAIVSVKNLLTGEQYIQQAGPNWLDLTLSSPSGESLAAGSWSLGSEPNGSQKATIEFADSVRSVSLTVAVAPDEEIAIRFRGHSTTPGVISATWGIYAVNLSQGRLVIPAQAGTFFDATSTPESIGLDYPVHWENQMVIYEGRRGSVLLYSPDESPHYQRLHASRQTGVLDMAIEMFSAAPFETAHDIPAREWRFAGFEGDWRAPATHYKNWMNTKRPPATTTPDREWIRKIQAVVVFLTPDTTLLETIAKELVPSKTLIHFVDWRSHPFDLYYPDYTPSELGKYFVERAHKLGFRVMLHTNTLGISEVHPLYSEFKDVQMKRSDNLKPIGWLWDDFPQGHPRRVAYISPASARFRKVAVDSLRRAVEELKPDAIHLDAGGAINNDGNGLIDGMNTMEGIIQLERDLLEAFPGVVFGGESTNEIIGPFNWLAQRWPSSSPPHPVSDFLVGDQVLFYGFLDQPPPDEPNHVEYLKRYEGQGVVPVVVLTDSSDLGPDRVRTFELLRRLRRWQDRQFRPAWDESWGGSLFRYRSANGSNLASIETESNFVRLQEDGETIYQRVRDSNRVSTPLFINRWPVYDETSLFGLHPNRQYWLEREPYRPSGEVHLRSLPQNFQVGDGSFANAQYGYFELQPVEKLWFDFTAELAQARTGTLYDGKDYPLVNGSFVTMGHAVVGGVPKNSVLIALPPYRNNINGATFVEYKIPVPIASSVSLTFKTGIADSTGRSDGALFGVQVEGVTEWRQTVLPGKWQAGSIDLTRFAGSTIMVRFLTHAGEKLNALFDGPCWGDLQIETKLQIPQASLNVGVPTGSLIQGLSEGVKLGESIEQDEIRLDLPAQFAVFVKAPPTIKIGESLLDFPYETWKAPYGGLPFPFAVDRSGSLDRAVSGGVVSGRALASYPPRNGSTLITTALSVPKEAGSLVVGYGLADAPAEFGPDFEYSGVEFSVCINGRSVFAEEVRTAGWRETRIDLQDYRGKPALIQLKTDSQKIALFDWAYWTNLTLQ